MARRGQISGLHRQYFVIGKIGKVTVTGSNLVQWNSERHTIDRHSRENGDDGGYAERSPNVIVRAPTMIRRGDTAHHRRSHSLMRLQLRSVIDCACLQGFPQWIVWSNIAIAGIFGVTVGCPDWSFM